MRSILGLISVPLDLSGLRLAVSRYLHRIDGELSKNNYKGSVIWDPASIADGDALESADIDVAGAAEGDHVKVFPPYSLQGVGHSAYVRADNKARIVLDNNTGGAVDLDEGEWRLICQKY